MATWVRHSKGLRASWVAALTLFGVLAAPGGALAQPAWSSNYFHSPSGNIRCREFINRDLMACLTLNDHFAVIVPLFGRARKERHVAAYQFPRGPALAYGERWRDSGRFRCTSRTSGMSCSSLQTGHGFFIERYTYSLY